MATKLEFPYPQVISGIKEIAEEARWPMEGQGIAKTGFVTGQTAGTVSVTCWDIPWAQDTVLLCQDLVAGLSNSPGDSGAPMWVEICICTQQLRVYGMFIGESGNEAVMSAMYNIEYELGDLNVTL